MRVEETTVDGEAFYMIINPPEIMVVDGNDLIKLAALLTQWADELYAEYMEAGNVA